MFYSSCSSATRSAPLPLIPLLLLSSYSSYCSCLLLLILLLLLLLLLLLQLLLLLLLLHHHHHHHHHHNCCTKPTMKPTTLCLLSFPPSYQTIAESNLKPCGGDGCVTNKQQNICNNFLALRAQRKTVPRVPRCLTWGGGGEDRAPFPARANSVSRTEAMRRSTRHATYNPTTLRRRSPTFQTTPTGNHALHDLLTHLPQHRA